MTANEKRVINLIGLGFFPADIARKMKVSSPYVNTLLKKLLSRGLIQRTEPKPRSDGRREYHHFYEVGNQAKAIMSGTVEEQYTPWRTHFIRLKFKIVSQSAAPSKDKRSSYSKSWNMRGGERYKFWYSGKQGLPSVTLDVHPHTIVGYVDRGQKITAKSKEEAQHLGWVAIYKARDKFIEDQRKFGIVFETEHSGVEIGKAHIGMVFHEGGPLDYETRIPGTWVDKSIEKECGPGFKEFEMHIDHELATPLEKGVMAVAKIGDTVKESIQIAMPEAMKEFERTFAPLTSEIHMVMAHIQSGQSVQNQINQLVVLVAQLVKDNHDLKERLEKRGN